MSPPQLTTKVGLSAHLQALARMPSTLVPERELMAIAKAYNADPNNPDFRFRHFFHNVTEPHHRVRPPGVDELKWRNLLEDVGGEHNAAGLWPVPGDGFKCLAERAAVQDAELANQREYLKAVQDRARDIERFRGAQLAEKVQLEPERVRELLRYSQDPLSLDSPVGEEDESNLGDFIEDESVDGPADAATRAMLTQAVGEVLGELSEREQEIVRLRFGLDGGQAKTLEEVGKEFGVTRERIRQIEAKTLAKLRHPQRSQRLREFLEVE